MDSQTMNAYKPNLQAQRASLEASPKQAQGGNMTPNQLFWHAWAMAWYKAWYKAWKEAERKAMAEIDNDNGAAHADTQAKEGHMATLEDYKDLPLKDFVAMAEHFKAQDDVICELRNARAILEKEQADTNTNLYYAVERHRALSETNTTLAAELNALREELKAARRTTNMTINFTLDVAGGTDISKLTQDLAKYGRVVTRYGT